MGLDKNAIAELNAYKAENVTVNIVKFGAVGNANYYNSLDNKYYVDSGYTTLAHDDTQAFIDAINYAKTHGGRVITPKGSFWVSSGKLPLYEGLALHGISSGWYYPTDSNFSSIRYTGTDYLFDSSTVAGTIGYPDFQKFAFVSNIGAGGMLSWNKGVQFIEDTGNKTLLRLKMSDVLGVKRVASSGALEGLGNSFIEGVGIMNSDLDRCIIKGWDLALNMPQCDINEFNHCLFTENAQLFKLDSVNSWGTQNKFNFCDFEVRRNWTSDYQIVDYSKYTEYNSCYFQQGVCNYPVTNPTPTHPTYNKIKGWFSSDKGEKNLIACRFDFYDGFFVESLFNIKKTAGMNLIGCWNGYTGYYNNVSQKVIVEAQNISDGTDANVTLNYGFINLIGCNSYFISHFDLEDKQIELVGRKRIDTLNQGKLLNSNIFYDRNMAFSGLDQANTVTLVNDTKSTRKQVFLLAASTSSGSACLGKFNLNMVIGQNSIVRKNQTYDIRVRLRVETALSDPVPCIRIGRWNSARVFQNNIVDKTLTNVQQSTDYKDYFVTVDTSAFADGEIFQVLVFYKGTANDATKKAYVEEVEIYNTTPKVYL